MYDRTTDWQTPILTATSFLAMFVTLLFGTLDALDASRGFVQELTLGTLCGISFVASLHGHGLPMCPEHDS